MKIIKLMTIRQIDDDQLPFYLEDLVEIAGFPKSIYELLQGKISTTWKSIEPVDGREILTVIEVEND